MSNKRERNNIMEVIILGKRYASECPPLNDATINNRDKEIATMIEAIFFMLSIFLLLFYVTVNTIQY